MLFLLLIGCSTTTTIHLKPSLPPRPSKPQITALDEGEAVGLSKADFVKLTRYIILLEGYADALEIALQE
ncbi:hypothetical protein [Entomospira culicis]|uniref:Uncharacterized protein n=1 Tax=Entomospira culicis TaxID=2719989 RepID=A0A968GK26_9SPIO|nr:hypothetical protein [Entomospira culicis]NIZ19081.1 hypothetical protein [Entomospira culicis]NIZ69295.1 hypothetical protein [Entomospira culicis]WDI37881.1 hypothetical protein PVA46_03590 [Entomospira culicis]WDI39508.1 hypothetical protein PVA47_03590 [Entomospira culicis]